MLSEGNAVSSVFVADANEDGLTLAGDEHVLLSVYGDAFFGEDRNCSIIGDFAYAH